MAEGTIGSFLTKISNEVEKQMNDDLKSFDIDANELEFLINCVIIRMVKPLANWLKSFMLQMKRLSK